MVAPFKFVSQEEFEKLGSKEKLKYLSDAMAELQRRKTEVVGWSGLFKGEGAQQQQQQPQSDQDEPKGKPEP